MIKLFFIILTLAGCSQLQRSQESGYAQPRSSGLRKSTIRTEPIKLLPTSEKSKLQSLENSLNTKKEIEQYSKMLPWFESDSEKIEFLLIGNFEDKQKWLNENKFLTRPQKVMTEMDEMVQVQDISVGMPQALVKKSWGEPDIVEVSGNPQFRNERWRYNRYVSTSDGYKPEKKIVYFEGGKVVGWELE